VVGSSGCLGSVICKQLSRQGVSVIGADMIQRDNKDDPSLTGFVSLPRKTPLSLTDLTTSLYSGVSEVLKTTNDSVPSSQSLSAIIVAAGGWQGDAPLAPHEDAIEGAAEYAAVIDAMQSQNLNPVLAAGYLIPYFMTSENGKSKAIVLTRQ
jgi:NAD(P)-dependent dehydrogenase (short-subunit alcohol dehydrogenase family)